MKPAMEIQHISFANADELMDAANSDYIRFSIPKPGCTASQMSLVTLGGIRCIRHAFQFAGNAEGCTPANVYSFLFSLDGMVFCKGKPYLENILVVHPPGDHFFNHAQGPNVFFGIYIPRHVWESWVIARHGAVLGLKSGRIAVEPAKFSRIQKLVLEMFEAGNSVFGNHLPLGDSEILLANLLDALASIVFPDRTIDPEYLEEHDFRLFLHGLRIMDTHGDLHISMEQIADELDISKRKLQMLFNQQSGLSPLRLMILRRMSLVRQEIRDRRQTKKSIAEIAIHHGFWHLGRFAALYRKIFGELPSQTVPGPEDSCRSLKNKFGIRDDFFFC